MKAPSLTPSLWRPSRSTRGFRGRAHWYASDFGDLDDVPEVFDLWRLDEKTLALMLESDAIGCRWHDAWRAGEATHDSHPALPAERTRWQELERLLQGQRPPERAPDARAEADFVLGEDWRVRWRVIYFEGD